MQWYLPDLDVGDELLALFCSIKEFAQSSSSQKKT
jgi:hypothetical protein